MNQIKIFMTKLLSLIDSGKFFIRPMEWLYMVFAVLSFIPPIFVLLYFEDVTRILEYMEGWAKFSGYLFFFFFVVFVFVAALLMFQFWMNRSRKVARVINEGDQIVAMPVVAHLFQSTGEAYGVYTCIVPPLGGVLFYVWCVITGFKFMNPFGESSEFFKYFFMGLLVLILFTLACLLVGYLLILLAHYVGESIRVRAQIANDVRDLGDIHRAATLIREAEAAAKTESATGTVTSEESRSEE